MGALSTPCFPAYLPIFVSTKVRNLSLLDSQYMHRLVIQYLGAYHANLSLAKMCNAMSFDRLSAKTNTSWNCIFALGIIALGPAS